MASITPSSFNCASACSAHASSFMTTDSVISNSSIDASIPVSLMMADTKCGKSLSTNCCPETLTAMRDNGNPSSTQLLACLQALRSTHSPIPKINPVSSATGMNSAGGTTPNSSLVQRSKASIPATPPERTSNCG